MREAKPAIPAALGFRVKSGWAMAALLAGSVDNPQLVFCRSVLLSDPKFPQSKQPHHPALKLSEKEGKALTRKLRTIVRGAAKKSVAALLKEAAELKYNVRGAALVVGSMVDPATLHNDHIRAHGLEGQLFRSALQDALRAQRIRSDAFLQKGAYETASPALKRAPPQAKQAIAELGESHDGSWRAEEKLATLAGWVALARCKKA